MKPRIKMTKGGKALEKTAPVALANSDEAVSRAFKNIVVKRLLISAALIYIGYLNFQQVVWAERLSILALMLTMAGLGIGLFVLVPTLLMQWGIWRHRMQKTRGCVTSRVERNSFWSYAPSIMVDGDVYAAADNVTRDVAVGEPVDLLTVPLFGRWCARYAMK